jgi:hypothetical protein
MVELSYIALHPAAKPSARDVRCVFEYLYDSTRLSVGPIKAVTIESNHTIAGTAKTWGHTVTTTWDGTAGLLYSPSDTWRPSVYFDMQGDLGAEPYKSYNRSVSRIGTQYDNSWKYWPMLSWSWHRSSDVVTWSITIKQQYGPRTLIATFDSSGRAVSSSSSGTESMPVTGNYSNSVQETFVPYTGPPIVVH